MPAKPKRRRKRRPRLDPKTGCWRCCRCRRSKPRCEFYGAAEKPRPYCKTCDAVFSRRRREAGKMRPDPERKRQHDRDYVRRHKAEKYARDTAWRQTPIGRLVRSLTDTRRRARLSKTEDARQRNLRVAEWCEQQIAKLRAARAAAENEDAA